MSNPLINLKSEAGDELIDKLKVLLSIKEEVAIQEAEVKELKKSFNALEEECFISMEQKGIQNLNIDGRTMYRNVRMYANVNGVEKENAHTWLKVEGYGDLFYETINSNTLSSVMKEYLAEGGEIPENLINMRVVSKIGIRKS